MDNKHAYILYESFLQEEIILGVAIGVSMLLMVVSEAFGLLMVMLGVIAVAGIYIWRIYSLIRKRGEAVQCCFEWFNNGTMILAVTGILLLMLLNAFRRPVFYSAMAIISIALLLNGLSLTYNIRGMAHITAQIRLVIAMVLLVVFFLL